MQELHKVTSTDLMAQLRAEGINSLDDLVQKSLQQARDAAAKGGGDPSPQVGVLYDSGKWVLIFP